MKKIYKVWAQNCICAPGKRIIEIDEKELRNEIDKLISLADECGCSDIYLYDSEKDEYNEKEYDRLFEKALNYFKENEYMSMGDYDIVFDEHDNICIPNVSYPDFTILEN